jgi:hypothetical protein
MTIAFLTCCKSVRHRRGAEMLQGIVDLGGDTPLSKLTSLALASAPLISPAEISVAGQRCNALFNNDDESLVLSG